MIMWGMSIVGPQGQGSLQSSASGTFGERLCVSPPPYEPRTDMIQGFVPWDSTRAAPQEYAFQPSLAEVAYRQALKELLVAQARLTIQEREAAQQPFNLTSQWEEKGAEYQTQDPVRKEVPNDVPTLRWIDGA